MTVAQATILRNARLRQTFQITSFTNVHPTSQAAKPMTAPSSAPAHRRFRHASAPAMAPSSRPGLPSASAIRRRSEGLLRMPMSDRRYLLVAPACGFLEIQVGCRFAHAGFAIGQHAAQLAGHGKSLDCPGRTGDDFDDYGSISCPALDGRVVVHILVWWGGLDPKDARAGAWPQKVKDVSGPTRAQEKVIPFRASAVTVSDDLELQ
jgi:hypothetical protein